LRLWGTIAAWLAVAILLTACGAAFVNSPQPTPQDVVRQLNRAFESDVVTMAPATEAAWQEIASAFPDPVELSGVTWERDNGSWIARGDLVFRGGDDQNSVWLLITKRDGGWVVEQVRSDP
jgi:hypothetical protein